LPEILFCRKFKPMACRGGGGERSLGPKHPSPGEHPKSEITKIEML